MPDPRTLTFTIPALPPRPLWPNRAKMGPGWTPRAWHGYRAGLKDGYSLTVYYAALKAVREAEWLPPNRAKLTLTFIVPTRRSYDEDNLTAAFKWGRDQLVTAGVLWSDGPECIVSATASTYWAKGVEAVNVKVTEVLE